MPYNLYGIQADYYINVFMSVTLYFVAFIGKILHVENSLFLFKLGLILEEFLFVYGTYLLTKQMLTRRMAQLFVTIGVIATTYVQAQIFFSFRMYYLVPLVIVLLINFLNKKGYYFLWLAVIVEIVSFFGNGAYLVPVHLYIFIVLTLSLIYFVNRNIYEIMFSDVFSMPSIITFIAMCVTAGIYIDMTTHLFDNVMVYAKNRLPGIAPNPFSGYIDYVGGTIDNIWQFIYAAPTTADQILFIGTIPIVFIIYALISETKNRYLPVFAVTTFFIVLLSLSRASFVAYITYYAIPFMPYTRHLSYVLSATKLFLLIIAGFGVDKFYNKINNNDSGNGSITKDIKIIVYICAALVVFILFSDLLFSNKFPYPNHMAIQYSFHYFSLMLLICFMLYLLRSIKYRGMLFKYAIVIFYFVEIFSFYFIVIDGLASRLEPSRPRNAYNEEIPYPYSSYLTDISKVKEKFNVKPYKYQNIRFPHDNTTSVFVSLKKYMTSDNSILYSAYYIDVCIPKLRHEQLPLGLDRYYRARYGVEIDKIFLNYVSEIYKLEGDPITMSILGCGKSKLWIASDVVFADDLKDATNKISIVASISDLRKNPVILRNYTEEYALSNSKNNIEYKYNSTDYSNMVKIEEENIKVLSFTANTIILEAFITNNNGAWLVYADSYHPNWTANVNGKYRSIAMANLAFKAVKLDNGNNKVIFNFKGNHRMMLYVKLLIALSVIFWSFIVLIIIKPKFIVN